MRKFKLYSAALAGLLALGACSSSDDLDGGTSGENKGNTSYLTVNINSVGAAPTTKATRGEYDATDKNGNKGSYEDGEGAESAINKVRFYFFNTDGSPYILNSAGEGVLEQKNNYVDVKMEKGTNDSDHALETITQAKLVLNGESNLAPASMLTVVNPDATDGLLGESAQRFSVLRTGKEGSTWKNQDGFVMSNSVYQEAGVAVCSTQLAGKLSTSAEAAKEKPVDVYVERVLAKVTANIDENAKTSDGDNTWVKVNSEQYAGTWRTKVGTLSIAQNDGSSKSYPVYAWIQGWGVADRNGKAELYKQIKVGEWTDATLGIKPWNTSDFKRCFWSNSCAVNNDNPLQNTAYNSYTNKMGEGAEYVMPNTPLEIPNNPYESQLTKLLVAVKLGYQDDGGTWKPAEICEYKGQEILGADQVKNLILKENAHFFIKDGNEYKNMTADNIEFVTSNKLKDYQVVAQLKGVEKLYIISDDGLAANEKVSASYTEMSVADVNQMLAENPIEIRNQGDAYYYTPIKHLGKEGSLGEYGIVRNHSYKVTINSIKGFGTPVYDPNKVIVPTQPSDDKSYLAAKVNVLSWRVVNSSVDLSTINKK